LPISIKNKNKLRVARSAKGGDWGGWAPPRGVRGCTPKTHPSNFTLRYPAHFFQYEKISALKKLKKGRLTSQPDYFYQCAAQCRAVKLNEIKKTGEMEQKKHGEMEQKKRGVKKK